MNIDGTCQVLAEGLAKLDEIDESVCSFVLVSAPFGFFPRIGQDRA